MPHECKNCGQGEMFDGFDTCLECSVAIAIAEQPDYLDFARRTFTAPKYASWLEKLEAEYERQLGAISHLARAVA